MRGVQTIFFQLRQNLIVFDRPVVGQCSGTSQQTRTGAACSLSHCDLNFDLLAIWETEILGQFNGLAVDDPRESGLPHDSWAREMGYRASAN